MIAGSDGLGGIFFNNPRIAKFIGIISLNFILFSGGLDTDWKQVKPVLKVGLSLSTLGVLLTALSLGTFVWFITDFTIYESLLLGSIVSSTDAAAVFSILRAKNLGLKAKLRPTLELESGSNDPMANVLTIAFLSLVVNQDQGIYSLIPLFFVQMIVGGLLGFGFGWLSKFIINEIKLDFEGLYPVLVISLMLITFSFTEFIGGNGFLAIYICAVFLGNQDLIHKKTILKMFDGMAWLMQIILFLTLGLLVFPSQLFSWPVMRLGLIISLFLILLARPISVFMSLLPFKMRIRKQLYISWVGLRGAVPIVFATYPLLAGIEKANMIFNIVFFISISSILIQGTTLSLVAKWLKLALSGSAKPLSTYDTLHEEYPKAIMKEFEIKSDCPAIERKIVDLAFPPNAIIAMIKRDNKYLTPRGSTIIKNKDILVVLSENKEILEDIKEKLRFNPISST
jgi:cell volume regulation protein A